MFEIPIVIFFMKRKSITLRVIERISKVKPTKMYLISDGGRSKEEHLEVEKCREAVEKAIDWNCEIITNYSETNKGILDRIGFGSMWVLEREKYAIFLEDDNLPSISFFRFCKEMLEKYESVERVLWICGTNYLTDYKSNDDHSYVFTHHTLPCGWASWGNKFNKFYDANLDLFSQKFVSENIGSIYNDTKLERQKLFFISETYKRIRQEKKVSWDHQMTSSILSNSLYGIAPKMNLIENIGVGNETTHGGSSFRNPMTKRFCSMKSLEMEFPLVHPPSILVDKIYEKKVGKIITIPTWYFFGIKSASIIRKKLGISNTKSFSEFIFNPIDSFKSIFKK